MSVNPAEEESESINEVGRIARGLGMAGMQMREAQERKRDRADRQTQTGEAEQHRQAQDRHRDGAESAKALHKDAYSSQFWKSTSNAHLARSITDAQDLAAQGHGPANSAYMAFADRTRDLHGFNIESVAPAGADGTERFNALQAALDDHNAAGRLRAEVSLSGHAAESVREEQQAQAEDTATHDPALRQAAMREAADAGFDTDEYLDQLSAEQRDGILNDPDNLEARDARMSSVAGRDSDEVAAADQSSETPEAVGSDADATHAASNPQEKHYDTAADTARDDAARAQSHAATSEAAASLPQSQHGHEMRRHLDNAAKRDPQAAAARQQSSKNLPNSGKDYVHRSISSNSSVRKASQQQASRPREQVQQR